MKKILIIGYRDFGFEIAELAEENGYEVIGFVDYQQQGYQAETELPVAGLPVYQMSQIGSITFKASFACAMTSTLLRQSLSNDVIQHSNGKLTPATLIHPNATISKTSKIGTGSMIAAQAVLATGSRLGKMSLINRGATIGHHTELGDYCFVGPGSNIGGNCHINDNTYIGIGATVLNHMNIGSYCLVSAASLVTKDVADHTQVLGVPARVLKEDFPGL